MPASEITRAIDQFHADYAAERGPEVSMLWTRASDSATHLEVVLWCYEQTAEELLMLGRKVGDDAAPRLTTEEWDRFHELGTILEVDIASFFAFASILLDMVARAAFGYGGPERGYHIGSQHDLVEDIANYSGARGYPPPSSGLLAQARGVYESVSETRNKVFVHPETWKESFGGFSLGIDGPGLSLGYSGDLEKHPNATAYWKRARALLQAVPTHIDELERYVAALLAYVATWDTAPAQTLE